MSRLTFADFEYGLRRRTTKRDIFLRTMDDVIPWEEWIEFIKPFYFKGERGRPPKGIEVMLRMYLLQCWFNLSDEGVEEAIYDSHAMRAFMKINFVEESVPDATTLLKFRHILKKNNLGKVLFEAIRTNFERHGYIMQGGSVVDATIIAAPSSTKNKEKARDPEMHSTKKGNQYYFGMKCHVGVDAGSGYVHTVETTAANAHDITVTSKLIRPEDAVVYGDSGYIGIQKREEIISDPHLSEIDYRINRRYKSVQKMPDGWIDWEKNIEKSKSSVRSKVEHPFLIVKRTFGFAKTVYKGLKKNTHRLYVLFTSANLLMRARTDRSLRPVRG